MTLTKKKGQGEKKRDESNLANVKKKVGHSNTVFTAVNIHCERIGFGPDLPFFFSPPPSPSPILSLHKKMLLLLGRCPSGTFFFDFYLPFNNIHSFFRAFLFFSPSVIELSFSDVSNVTVWAQRPFKFTIRKVGKAHSEK